MVEAEYLDRVDEEVRDSMGLVSEAQYRELFERYVLHVSHWVKGEKMRNRVTGEMERPDEARMAEMEADRHAHGRGPRRVPPRAHLGDRRAPARQPGAGEMDYAAIFPDLFRRLRDHYFEERKRQLRRNKENMLRYLSDDRAGLDEKARRQVEATLGNAGAVRLLRGLRQGRHPVPDAAALRGDGVRRQGPSR